MKISNFLYFPSVLAFIFGIILMFQNCSGVGNFNMKLSSLGISAQVNCVAASGAHSCVVKKNLFYGKRQMMDSGDTEEFDGVTEEMDNREGLWSENLSLIDYRDLPLQAVHLPFLDDSNLLKNSTFQVLSYMRKPVYRGTPLKFSYEPDNGVALSQVTSYYYSSLARSFSRDMDLSLVGKGLYIITQAPVTGWSSEDNTIYLGREGLPDQSLGSFFQGQKGTVESTGGMMGEGANRNPSSNLDEEEEPIEQNQNLPSDSDNSGIGGDIKTVSDPHESALDGGIILNLIAEANIYYATKGAINEEVESRHKTCQIPVRAHGGTQSDEIEEACCVDKNGCSKAISMGLSLYFSSYFFQDAPTVGEVYSRQPTGMEDCGISRDLNKSKDVTIEEAFRACGDKGEGYVYPMATVYASIWWNVRKEILNKAPEEVENFQRFYLEYLKELTGSLTFTDAYELIVELDAKSFGSKFTNYFNEEMKRRGVDFKLASKLLQRGNEVSMTF